MSEHQEKHPRFIGMRKQLAAYIGCGIAIGLFVHWLNIQFEIDQLLIQAKMAPQVVDWTSRALVILAVVSPLIGYMGMNVLNKKVQNGTLKKPQG